VNKIIAAPEGRQGIYIVDQQVMAAWLAEYPEESIHNFLPSSRMMMGADWDKQSVIDEVLKADRVAVLTGAAARRNMRHALSVVSGPRLAIFDIGEITDADIDLIPSTQPPKGEA